MSVNSISMQSTTAAVPSRRVPTSQLYDAGFSKRTNENPFILKIENL